MFNPHISPTFYCGGPTACPDWRLLGQSARHSVNYACALFSHERQSGHTFDPPRYERWGNMRVKFAFITLIAGLLYSAGMAQANVLRDPMRPSRIKQNAPMTTNVIKNVKSTVRKKKKLQLSAIFYQSDTDSRSAIVNGLYVKKGSHVGGATIRQIHINSVELSRKGKIITLRLNPRVKMDSGG